MTRVEIDLNIRVRGNWTLAGLEDADGEVHPGDFVDVFEPESGITGPGQVEEVDLERRVIYLSVDWGNLQLPGANLATCFGALINFGQGSGVAEGHWSDTWPHQATNSTKIPCSA